ncbi:single-stranded DNA-binding protein [Gallibacterium anatis]|uniref:Single-stranded DNA-binding protein n=1 Tax=Gallibacterium anatis 4895 TaxID=1396510 RepID=A0A0A3ARJ2_9PAST|nr:single-stranded DNA-binding protein [Gallibacterium anatis]KGQ64084.1 single-stranded DNA-binding protein [Gallibacterium anatis 4895]
MAGINQVTILGNLGADPDVKKLANNNDVMTTLSVATSRTWKDKQTGELVSLTEWHRIVLYRRLAEIAAQYLHKGSKVYVQGYLRTQKWTDENKIDHWTTSIIGETLQLLDTKPTNKDNKPEQQAIQEQNIYDESEPPPF